MNTWRCIEKARLIGLLALLVLAVVLVAACGESKAASSAPDNSGQKAAAGTPSGGVVGAGVALTSKETPDPENAFFCYVEVLTGDRPSIYGYQAPKGCVPAAEFRRGELMVIRFVILDTTTGKKVTDNEAQSVKVRLPDGTILDAVYKQRGDGRVASAPWTWDVCWDIPLEYPVGVLDYTILISTKDGRSGTWKPPALVDPVRGIDSRPRIVP